MTSDFEEASRAAYRSTHQFPTEDVALALVSTNQIAARTAQPRAHDADSLGKGKPYRACRCRHARWRAGTSRKLRKVPMTESCCIISLLDDEDAIELLAKESHWKTWALDPRGEKADWDAADELEKEGYRQSVKWLLIQAYRIFDRGIGPTSA